MRIITSSIVAGLATSVVVLSSAFAEEGDYSRGSLGSKSKGTLASGQELLPPNAKPGECYARVFVPPEYQSIEKQVLSQDPSDVLSVKPAQFDKATEEIVVEEASYKLEIVPAEYEWVEERIEISPAYTELRKSPATYETVTEKIIDKPAQTVWKKGRGPVEKVDNGTGEIMCLVEVPATYKTISKKIVKEQAKIEPINIPAKYKTVKRKVLKSPPSTRKVEIPAKTSTVTRTVMVKPAEQVRETTPAEYQTVTQTQLVKEGRMDWQAVLCETNTTKGKVKRIQQALRDEGYNPGTVDGNFGKQTAVAIKKFQRDQGLAQGGITIETLSKLGVGV